MNRWMAIALLTTSFVNVGNEAVADDDDDNGVGLYVNGEMEVSQGQVFGPTDAIRVWSEGNLRVTGGEIRGGVKDVQLGDGIDINHVGNVEISGGNITATDDAVKVKADGRVSVSGGTLTAEDDGISTVRDATAHVSNGTVSGGVHGMFGRELSHLALSGGTVNGGIRIQDESSLRMSGGTVNGAMRLHGEATLNILGGRIDGLIEANDSSQVNLFLNEDGSTLLDGSSSIMRIQVSETQEDVRFNHLLAVTSDRRFQSPQNHNSYGIVSTEDSPTKVVVAGNDALRSLYVLDNSEVTLESGSITGGVVADDESKVTVHNTEFRQGWREAIMAKRSSRIEIEGGSLSGWTHGLHLKGRSRTMVSGGKIRGNNRDGIHATTFADVRITGGEISGPDEGIRASDDAMVDIRGGRIEGGSNGISISGRTSLSLSGGEIVGTDHAIRMRDDTHVSITGGHMNNRVLAENGSLLDITGGEIVGDVIGRQSANIHLSDGAISDDLRLTQDARLIMKGGRVGGDLSMRDGSTARVSAGMILGDIVAEDTSKIQIVGTDLVRSNDRVLGKLLDGGRIRGEVEIDDKATLELFEGLVARSQLSSRLPKDNYAVVDAGNESRVDFLPGVEVEGNLLVTDGGRANFFGGNVGGAILGEKGSIRAFYGRNIQSEFTGDEDVWSLKLSGKAVDDSPFEVTVVNNTEFRIYEIVNDRGRVSPHRSIFVAVVDAADGPTFVELEDRERTHHVEIHGASEVETSGNASSHIEAFGLWDSARLTVKGGNVRSFGNDAIFARDSGHVHVRGGDITGTRDGVRIWHASSLQLDGGRIAGSDDGIDVKNNATMVMTGGNVRGGDDGVKVKDNAVVSISGGRIEGADDGVSLSDQSRARIVGSRTVLKGARNGLLTIDGSQAEIRGGHFVGEETAVLAEDTSHVYVFGGRFENEVVANGGSVTVIGSELTLNEGSVEGLALDGTAISIETVAQGDGQINVIETYYGDSNLDGEFNSNDLVLLFGKNEYEDDIALNSTWFDGDWNGDGDFTSGDLVLAFNQDGYEKGPRTAISSVPEPNDFFSWMALLLVYASRKRKQ